MARVRRLEPFVLVAFILVILVIVLPVRIGGHPEPTFTVAQGLVLPGEIDALTLAAVLLTSLGEITSTDTELGGDGRVGFNPVREGILAILNDTVDGQQRLQWMTKSGNTRFARPFPIIRVSGFAGSNRGIVNQLQQVLAVPSNDRKLLAVFAERIELVGEGCLELLSRNVGQLGFGNERLSLGTDELLLEDDNAWAVGFLVLELGDLIGNLLLA